MISDIVIGVTVLLCAIGFSVAVGSIVDPKIEKLKVKCKWLGVPPE